MTLDKQDLARVRTPVLIVTVLAWVLLVASSSTTSLHSHCLLTVSGATSPQNFLRMLFAMNPPIWLASGWFLMLVAMMAPVMIWPIRHIYRRTFANRRWRSILFFLTGYTTVWMVSGALIVALELILRLTAPDSYLPAGVAFLFALIWQCSPFKQRCLNRCHNHRELAAFGSAADFDSFNFGVFHGLWCTGSCWLWMLLPMLLPQAYFLAMFAVTLLIISERLEQPCSLSWRPRGFGRVIRLCVAQARMLGHATENAA